MRSPSGDRAMMLVLAALVASVSSCGGDDAATSATSASGPTSTSSGSGGQGAGGAGGAGGAEDPIGKTCELAAEIETLDTPVVLPGAPFESTATRAGSCGYSAVAWFSFTAPQPGCYGIASDPGVAVPSAQAVFRGTTCAPLGEEIECQSGLLIDAAEIYLAQGEGCLIETTASGHWLPEARATWLGDGPGIACPTAYDLSSESFPFQLNGGFPCNARGAGSCATKHYNAGWFAYTATTTAPHTITIQNAGACSGMTSCDSTIAVFEGDNCAPLGSEVACETAMDSGTASTTVALTQGTSYRIAFSVDKGATNSTADLTVDISF